MTEIQFKLTGWKAIAAIAVVLALVIGRYMTMWSDLEPSQLSLLKLEIVSGYARGQLPALKAAVDSGDDDAAAAGAEALVASDAVQFDAISARGSPSDLVVRVELSVKGQTPPDGKRVRYFKMQHSTVTGWRVGREVSAWRYYSRLL